MSDALRELLASFVIEVDKAGELAKGNAQVDALKAKLTDLQASFAKVKAPAAQAAAAVNDVFARAAQQARRNIESIDALAAFGSGRGGSTGFGDAFAAAAPQYGPTRETLQTHQRAEFVADAHPGAQYGPTRETFEQGRAAAEAYAKTLRGKLAGAIAEVRAGFNGAGGGGQGPGLIASLATVRNGFLALGAGVAVHAIKGLVDGIGDISEGSARLGVTTDEFQRMSTYARQNATDVDTLGTAFRTLATSAVDPTKETTAAFAKLGVSTKDSSGQFKTSQELFFDVGESLAGVTNETVRTQLAQKLLGRSAIALKPMFAQGTEAFRKQREEMLKLKVLSPEVIDAADSLSDSWVALGTQLLATAGPVLEDVLFPALRTLTGLLVKGTEGLAKVIAKTNFTNVAIGALATGAGYLLITLPPLIVGLGGVATALGVVAANVAAALWPITAIVLGFAAISDAVGFLQGKDSVIGAIFDALSGKGTSTAVLDSIVTLWGTLAGFVKSVGDALGLIHLSDEDKVTIRKNMTPAGTVYAPPPRTLEEAAARERENSTNDGGPRVVVNANGPRNVTVNMSPSATAGDVGRAVGAELERDRSSIPAGVP
jgi:hypothetical protein